MIYLRLFYEFFKTGLFAIGGGLATLPFLSEMSNKFGWFSQEEIANMLAVSESTPGPIGVNMATYVGNTTIGVAGGVITSIALVLPSYLVVLAVTKVMERFKENPFVQSSMKTLRPASVGMVSAAILGVLQSVLLDSTALASMQWTSVLIVPNLLLFASLLLCCFKFDKLHPLVFLSIGAIAGIVLGL